LLRQKEAILPITLQMDPLGFANNGKGGGKLAGRV
jgi:hypothetical protein